MLLRRAGLTASAGLSCYSSALETDDLHNDSWRQTFKVLFSIDEIVV